MVVGATPASGFVASVWGFYDFIYSGRKDTGAFYTGIPDLVSRLLFRSVNKFISFIRK